MKVAGIAKKISEPIESGNFIFVENGNFTTCMKQKFKHLTVHIHISLLELWT